MMTPTSELSTFDELAELFCTSLNLYIQWAKQKGLSANEFYVLYHLAMAGECTQKDIANEWQIPKQTVSVVCKNLLEKGWLTFGESQSDKREKTLTLTELGKSVALPMASELTDIEQRTAEEFGIKKCAELISQLRQLNHIFAKNLSR